MWFKVRRSNYNALVNQRHFGIKCIELTSYKLKTFKIVTSLHIINVKKLLM